MNRVILVGRLTKDPELRKTSNDVSVVQFSLAVNRNFSNNGERKTDFINCVAWRGLADNLAKFMRKGSQIGVEGQLQVRQYEDTTGAKRNATEVICDNIHFLESKSAREGGFSDINSYDIPDYQSGGFGGGSFDSNPFGGNKVSSDGGSKFNNQTDADPFANLKTKTGASDDDLPF